MSLITCCPSCGTKFRVVADQLRISDGWVRCGRCQEVFDAQAALDTVDTAPVAPVVTTSAAAQQAAEWAAPESSQLIQPQPAPSATNVVSSQAAFRAPSAPVAAPEESAAWVSTGYELPAPPELELDFEIADMVPQSPKPPPPVSVGVDDWLDLPGVDVQREPALQPSVVPPSYVQATQTASASASAAPRHGESNSDLNAEETQASMWSEVVRFMHPPKPETDAASDDVEPATVAPASAAAIDVEPAWDGDAASAQPTHVPGFVKQAQRKAWWNQPGVRFAMGMLLIFLPIALLLQMVVHERNRIAAWKPEWRNGLDVMCVVLRCEITPYKNIASVVLTGSAFVQDAEPHHYKLDLSIHNQATMSVATPAVELTLTDAQDQVLVRKVLNLAEIGAPKELAARGEWNGTLPIMTQGLNLPVSGYRVMAFYP